MPYARAPLLLPAFTGFLHYYGPLRLPTLAARSVIAFHSRLCSFTHR